jgi:hypothetical protein
MARFIKHMILAGKPRERRDERSDRKIKAARLVSRGQGGNETD